MSDHDFTSGIMTADQIQALVDRMQKAERAHHAGFHLFGWAFNFGIRKVDPKYLRAKRVWWN